MNKFILLVISIALISCSKSETSTPTPDPVVTTPADPGRFYSVKVRCNSCTVSYDTKTSEGVKTSDVNDSSFEIKGYFVKNTDVRDVYDVKIVNKTTVTPAIDVVQPTNGIYSVSYSFAPIQGENNNYRLIIKN